jgi:hypothetical protein
MISVRDVRTVRNFLNKIHLTGVEDSKSKTELPADQSHAAPTLIASDDDDGDE